MDEYGTFYLDNRPTEFKFVFFLKFEDEKIQKLRNLLEEYIPVELVEYKKAKYSRAELKAYQDKIHNADTGATSIFVDAQREKVILEFDNTKTNSFLADTVVKDQLNKFSIDENIYEIKVIENTQKLEKARTDTFTVMGGGIQINGNCSTAATATKDGKQFLITAGHCISSIGANVTQGTTIIGVWHFDGRGSGYDIGLIRLTNTNKYISNQFFYSPLANAEYGKRYASTSSVAINQLICKSGVKTDVTCGTVFDNAGEGLGYLDTIRIEKSGGSRYSDGGDSGAITFNPYDDRIVGVHAGGAYYEGSQYSTATAMKISKLNALSEPNKPFSIYTSSTDLKVTN
ncbi:hypothetical protein RB620_22790 [Paenibacillus sp. LHD-117]|uniref:hypothetical protein n=1 Tax=Paenibacillus sp. LHD-117 TaxID=3071412 RepID=UPI0027E0E5A4|nr:hypothetical protein [Paenibacillus sp. LHD-117]MDQ6422259.1 hypothetical protein [Paenibacillus sp. LHD-117]